MGTLLFTYRPSAVDGQPPREAAAYGGTSAQEDLLQAYGCSRGARKFFTLISKAGPNVVESAASLTEFVPFAEAVHLAI